MARLAVSLAALGLLVAGTVSCRTDSLGVQLRDLLDGDAQQSNLQSRLSAVAVDNTVILTQTSCGYLEFAINWILHVQAVGITNWLTIVEDDESLAYLNERFPGHAILATLFTNEALSSGSVLVEYGSEAFTRLACARPNYLLTILDLGYSVVWSDTDTAWLQDFSKLTPHGLDYVGVDDTVVHADSESPEQETENACTGLMFLNPTDKAKALLSRWRDTCQELKYNNQPAWNAVFTQEARKDIAYHIMPRFIYPHGMLLEQVYSGDPEVAPHLEKLHLSPDNFKPAWIHANWRMGRAAKRLFLKDHSVWQVAPDQDFPTCSLVAGSAAHAKQDLPVAAGSSFSSVHLRRTARPQQHGNMLLQRNALADLLGEYVERHRRCLNEPEHQGMYVVVSTDDSNGGLGNRMLSVVTGMLLALMTQRCLFLHHDTYLREFRNAARLDMDWVSHEAVLANRGRQVSWARLGPRSIFAMSDTDPLYATANLTDLWAGLTAVDIANDTDYLVPLLYSNVHYGPFFDRFFPTREAFHDLATFLYHLQPQQAAAAEAFRTSHFGAAAHVIGLQIRTQKIHGELRVPSVSSYCTLARALILKQGGPASQVAIFVASDSTEAIEAVRTSLGADLAVVAVELGPSREVVRTASNNPGTEEAALLDMKLLSGCDALILTSGSSFGSVAAAWGGIVPLYVQHRPDGNPSVATPYFFRPLDSEPCYWGAHRYFLETAPEEAVAALLANPLWMQYAQCA